MVKRKRPTGQMPTNARARRRSGLEEELSEEELAIQLTRVWNRATASSLSNEFGLAAIPLMLLSTYEVGLLPAIRAYAEQLAGVLQSSGKGIEQAIKQAEKQMKKVREKDPTIFPTLHVAAWALRNYGAREIQKTDIEGMQFDKFSQGLDTTSIAMSAQSAMRQHREYFCEMKHTLRILQCYLRPQWEREMQEFLRRVQVTGKEGGEIAAELYLKDMQLVDHAVVLRLKKREGTRPDIAKILDSKTLSAKMEEQEAQRQRYIAVGRVALQDSKKTQGVWGLYDSVPTIEMQTLGSVGQLPFVVIRETTKLARRFGEKRQEAMLQGIAAAQDHSVASVAAKLLDEGFRQQEVLSFIQTGYQKPIQTAEGERPLVQVCGQLRYISQGLLSDSFLSSTYQRELVEIAQWGEQAEQVIDQILRYEQEGKEEHAKVLVGLRKDPQVYTVSARVCYELSRRTKGELREAGYNSVNAFLSSPSARPPERRQQAEIIPWWVIELRKSEEEDLKPLTVLYRACRELSMEGVLERFMLDPQIEKIRTVMVNDLEKLRKKGGLVVLLGNEAVLSAYCASALQPDHPRRMRDILTAPEGELYRRICRGFSQGE